MAEVTINDIVSGVGRETGLDLSKVANILNISNVGGSSVQVDDNVKSIADVIGGFAGIPFLGTIAGFIAGLFPTSDSPGHYKQYQQIEAQRGFDACVLFCISTSKGKWSDLNQFRNEFFTNRVSEISYEVAELWNTYCQQQVKLGQTDFAQLKWDLTRCKPKKKPEVVQGSITGSSFNNSSNIPVNSITVGDVDLQNSDTKKTFKQKLVNWQTNFIEAIKKPILYIPIILLSLGFIFRKKIKRILK